MEKMGKAKITEILPHRGRALLLDRVEVDEVHNKATGYLVVTKRHCEGHFPDNPIMRAVDRIEMIALTLGVAAGTRLPEGSLPLLYSFDRARFPGKAVPGDLIRTEAVLDRFNRRIIRGHGKAFVGDKLVAEAEDIVCLVGKPKKV